MAVYTLYEHKETFTGVEVKWLLGCFDSMDDIHGNAIEVYYAKEKGAIYTALNYEEYETLEEVRDAYIQKNKNAYINISEDGETLDFLGYTVEVYSEDEGAELIGATRYQEWAKGRYMAKAYQNRED